MQPHRQLIRENLVIIVCLHSTLTKNNTISLYSYFVSDLLNPKRYQLTHSQFGALFSNKINRTSFICKKWGRYFITRLTYFLSIVLIAKYVCQKVLIREWN